MRRWERAVVAVDFFRVAAAMESSPAEPVGIMVAAQAVQHAGEVHATLVWGGIRVTLITTVTGVLTLSLAGLLWFVLRLRYRKLTAG